MIEHLTNQYDLTKTLKFSLIPQGKTEENFNQNILEEDEKRAENYKKIKKIIDKYHIEFIENVLKNVKLSNLKEYAEVYYSEGGDKKDRIDKLKKIQVQMRKEVSKKFEGHPKYRSLFLKDLIEKDLGEFIGENEEEKEIIKSFHKFTTYFKGYNENRKNMYVEDEKTTAISYRIVNENLPKFLDNIKVYKTIKETLLENKSLEKMEGIYGLSLEEVFSVDYFNLCLSQKGIDRYNEILGGYAEDTGEKVQGINEYINLTNQQKNSKKLPQMKVLYKQILSDKESFSFVPEQFKKDQEVLSALENFYEKENQETGITYRETIQNVCNLLVRLNEFNQDNIYIKNDSSIAEISNKLYGSWSSINDIIKKEYDEKNLKKGKAIPEGYEEKRSKALKKNLSYSIKQIEFYGDNIEREEKNEVITISNYLNREGERLKLEIEEAYLELNNALKNREILEKSLMLDEKIIGKIKEFLDGIKAFQRLFSIMSGEGKEEKRDLNFYGEYENLEKEVKEINIIYDKVRNYVTQKPYSNEKIKINFQNPELLGGWPVGREIATSSLLFKKDNKYYLGVMDSKNKKHFKDYPEPITKEDKIDKMCYLQAADPQKDVQNLMVIEGKTVKKNGKREKSGEHQGRNLLLENLKNEYLPKEINEIRKRKSYSKSSGTFKKSDLEKFIDYYKERTIEYFSGYEFEFYDSRCYEDFGKFTDHINQQAYQIKFKPVSKNYIDDLVEEGKLYLFQIYNKDFSEYSKGKENLHTMYFKALFEEMNFKNLRYKLNGEAEMFYRKGSINKNNIVIHRKDMPIDNKNPLNKRKESTFTYDLIKDRRYTKNQFSLHLPITLNFTADKGDRINLKVRDLIKKANANYIIGIDRGERHLIYVSVIDNEGKICEQYSLNEIVNIYNEQEYRTDYQSLLAKKEKDRGKARQEWKSIETIKELKEGYISQVVHKICQLVEKYDAIIVMEDLNSGFKNSRKKVEKSVYQKFEKMLIDKLNYYVNKSKAEDEIGGLYSAYQLTEKFKSFKNMSRQNGIIFYVPAWLTSKIDPSTGFVDLIYPKYSSVEETKNFVRNINWIRFNAEEDYFEFNVDYDNFPPKGASSYRKEWTICANGKRVYSHKNKNSKWEEREVDIHGEFAVLFDSVNIDYRNKDVKEELLKIEKADFFKKFMHLFKLTLQMRNSKTGTEIDYLISPVKGGDREFYNSDNYSNSDNLPCDADANGAYNIARKGLWIVDQIKKSEDISKIKLAISNKEWLELAQKGNQ